MIVSAAIRRGAPYRIVQRWLARDTFDLIVSKGVLAEVEDVLTRPRLTKRISVGDALTYVRAIRTLADVVEDPVVIESLTRDPMMTTSLPWRVNTAPTSSCRATRTCSYGRSDVRRS
ncbi:MAG: hypothetical protein KDB21_20645 [Acidimicrobiales bacterium]|nr:hypothetical protein [Acidimicrobiales bacterium]